MNMQICSFAAGTVLFAHYLQLSSHQGLVNILTGRADVLGTACLLSARLLEIFRRSADDDLRADTHALVKVQDIGIGHAEAAG